MAVLVGSIAALASSYIGQFVGLFQAGQMLEWLCTIVTSCFVCSFYAAVAR
jgi:fluoride ion exporter CrcB/FEX